MPPPTLSFVIPAFNEEGSIRGTVDEIAARFPDAELIVVDDGSQDGTAAALGGSAAHVRVVRHQRNFGYGAALKTGVRKATGEVVVFIDADGQHDPADVDKLLPALGEHALVIGQRTQIMHSSLWRMPGKWLLGWLAQFLTRTTIPDLNSGLRAVRRELALDYLDICPDGFSMSTTLTVAALCDRHAVTWVPITIRKRHKGSASTVRVSTGMQTILLLLRLMTLFEPLRVFLPLATFFVLGGIGWGLPYALSGHGVSIGAMMLVVTGVLTFFFGLLADQNALLRRRRR